MIKAVLMALGCSFVAAELSAAGATGVKRRERSDSCASSSSDHGPVDGAAGASIGAPPAREIVRRVRQRLAGPTEAPVAAVPDFDLAAAPAIAVAMELDGDGRVMPAGAPGEPLAVTLAALIAAHSPERVAAGVAVGSPVRAAAGRALQLVVDATPPRSAAIERDIATELGYVVAGRLSSRPCSLNLASLGAALAAAVEAVGRYSTHGTAGSESAPAFGSRIDTDDSL